MNKHLLIANAVNDLFAEQRGDIDLSDKISLGPTRKEFEGDFTLVVFPFVKIVKNAPDKIAESIGWDLKEKGIISDFNVIKGFLNLSFSDDYWKGLLKNISDKPSFDLDSRNEKVLIEFSSPNTNKPLHLGHVRNILLGSATSNILKAAGYEVVNTQIVNDRGIAICKSMLAWQLFGDNATPESTQTKGDHFIGKYYVLFETKFKEEYSNWQTTEEALKVSNESKKEDETSEGFFKRYKNEYFNNFSSLGGQAKVMLQKWEAEDGEVRELWTKMNNWVYEGFEETYNRLDAKFDILYYESNTYILGKDVIDEGLATNHFYRKNDNSIWIDLSDVGLDEKLVLRSDGTSVYMTQDIGTVQKRFENHGTSKMIYVVATEQDYHFKALFEICKKLKKPYANGLHHLSYGMVDLPSGKMKSREGTVVDADDLMDEVIEEAKLNANQREVQLEATETEKNEIYRKIGLGALKYFILKVNPQKKMVFDPKESVDMQGDTGPYIQNAYVRIKSILRNLTNDVQGQLSKYSSLHTIEKEIIIQLDGYEEILNNAAQNYDPSSIANFAYQLARSFHRFYHDVRILKAESDAAKDFRLVLAKSVAEALNHSMGLLGIEMPEKM